MDPSIYEELLKTSGAPNAQKIKYYQEMIGVLLYIAQNTRPDIQFATSFLARFAHNHTDLHVTAVKRVYRYLSYTLHKKLMLSIDSSFQSAVYSDASWANKVSAYSTSGCVSIIDGSLVHWWSKKQATVVLSTFEAELNAITEAIKDAIWLDNACNFLKCTMNGSLTIVRNDNYASYLVSNEAKGDNYRARHIITKVTWIQDVVKKGDISVSFVPTELNLADVFTKPLCREKIFKFLDKFMFDGELSR
jgi:hypothetical protein